MLKTIKKDLPLIIDNFLQVNIFKNVTSLFILIGVITDVTAELRVYRVLLKYEAIIKRFKR
jgi:preprotein translocase subunit SecY